MKTFQLLSIIFTSCCLLLVVFVLNYEDPLISQYKECLEKSMQVENTTSEQDILMRYPQIRMALNCINKAKQLKSEIYSTTAGPAPDISQNEANKLTEMRRQFRDLRAEAKDLLEQIRFDTSRHGSPPLLPVLIYEDIDTTLRREEV